MIIALVGNQNCGKTTVFNRLCGENQHTGNWPGVTIERRQGRLTVCPEIEIVDLPGVYSLHPYTMEEAITRDFLIFEKPDMILNVVDASNLERNLYLTIQLMQLGRPVLSALNMMDELQRRGDSLDADALAKRMGIRVVPVCARDGTGMDQLTQILVNVKEQKMSAAVKALPMNAEIRYALQPLTLIAAEKATSLGLPPVWLAEQLANDDGYLMKRLDMESDLCGRIRREQTALKEKSDFDVNERIADYRYARVARLLQGIYMRRNRRKESLTDKLDEIFLHRYGGYPVLMLLGTIVFWLTFAGPGAWLSEHILQITDWLTEQIRGVLARIHTAEGLQGLICDGMMRGVGSVLSFAPMLVLLFWCLCILEECGYMARAAFLMDKPMRCLGLTGKSFIPMLMGFGCTVPAVLAARSAVTQRQRRLTMLLIPFMSCGAKVPVYLAVASACFPEKRTSVILFLYLMGIGVAIILGCLLKRTVFRASEEPFLMEFPPYRLPLMRNVVKSVALRLKDFVQRVCTVILLSSCLIWLLGRYDPSFRVTEAIENSLLGLLAGKLSIIFAPLGFASLETASALLTGLMAKESIVSTMTVMAGEIGGCIFDNQAAALSFLTFVLLYTPCTAALATIRRESGSCALTMMAALGQICIAWMASLGVYHLSLGVGLV